MQVRQTLHEKGHTQMEYYLKRVVIKITFGRVLLACWLRSTVPAMITFGRVDSLRTWVCCTKISVVVDVFPQRQKDKPYWKMQLFLFTDVTRHPEKYDAS